MDPIIIVGTGLAGYNLAKEYRKLNQTRPLILLTADDGRSYSKPMLSTGFTKQKSADELALADVATMAQQLQAQIRTFVQVSAIDTAARTLTLSNGETLTYGELVLAWGAGVFRPPLAGDAADQVYSINDLLDYDRFRKAVDGKQDVVIIGAGLIGCEFANDLRNGGFNVEVVEPMGRPLPTLLPAPASAALQDALEELGVRFHFGPHVKAVERKGERLAVVLSDGRQLDAEIVISAIGLRPRIQVAAEAGIAVDRGITVNRFLQTSAPNVYALGDCSEVEGNVMLYVLPLMSGARALAKTLAGEPTPANYPAMPVAIKTPACPVVVAPVPAGVDGEWTFRSEGRSVNAQFHDGNGTLRGFALTGDATQDKNALAKQLPSLLG